MGWLKVLRLAPRSIKSFCWLLATYWQVDKALSVYPNSHYVGSADVGVRLFYDQLREVEHCPVGYKLASKGHHQGILKCDSANLLLLVLSIAHIHIYIYCREREREREREKREKERQRERHRERERGERERESERARGVAPSTDSLTPAWRPRARRDGSAEGCRCR